MPDASDDRAVIYPPTGQRLVRFRTPAPTPIPGQRQPATRRSTTPPSTEALVVTWQASAAAVRSLRKFGATKPTVVATAEALEALHEAGSALIARVRQSYADAVQ